MTSLEVNIYYRKGTSKNESYLNETSPAKPSE